MKHRKTKTDGADDENRNFGRVFCKRNGFFVCVFSLPLGGMYIVVEVNFAGIQSLCM